MFVVVESPITATFHKHDCHNLTLVVMYLMQWLMVSMLRTVFSNFAMKLQQLLTDRVKIYVKLCSVVYCFIHFEVMLTICREFTVCSMYYDCPEAKPLQKLLSTRSLNGLRRVSHW